ncbi:hypothetical protein H8S00_05285 [Eubacterium sp. BX4]|uniref:Uncharacterized protein n=1 Tax=Eubacterium segne TaxID=2763045 RepID=A0ABR7F354_9FIRM|nr:hypothetical protein [Eubacterium segne]MBC5667399.1 hypothetical protein [Eubacterium segne]
MKKYILGFVTGVCLLPIWDSLTELLQVALEVPKGKLSKKVIKINNELQDIQEQSEPVNTCAIGFQIPDEEYYEDDDF